MNAVITAGARVNGKFAARIGTPVKALAPIGGGTLLSICLRSARDAGITRLAVVGGDEVRAACARDADRFIEETQSGAENLSLALHAWPVSEPVLYLTSDLPFLTAAALRDFIAMVSPGALSLPLTDCTTFEQRFPGAPPFGTAIGGERIVNGGAFWIPAGAAQRIEAAARRFFDARKSVARMAMLLGPVLCLRFAFGRLTIAAIEKRAERELGVPARAVRGAQAELAYDVDTLEEYEYAAQRS